ncbi:MAG: SGNH/GDSL hydrolase family protein [Chloroflexi bacterium]|nr:SGNH/GDSL hydrolase family protein [Chloroflexota bacterium]
MQSTIKIGFGVVTLLTLLGAVWSYRLDQQASSRIAAGLLSVFGSRWLALALVVLLAEFNILAQVLLRDIAPPITEPLRFLLFCWSLVFAGFLATLHWLNIRRVYLSHRNKLAIAGLGTAVFCIGLMLALVTSRLVIASGLHDRLRGRLDYRPLRFIDDGEAPTAQEFWEAQGQTKVRWLPYSYWVVAPFESEYINVDEVGLRDTISLVEDVDSTKVYFFGGSTAWGEGARDAYTIPSQVARLLAERSTPAAVLNYAQTGYVTTQDLILFQRQLTLGNLPDLAVFYQGFNDIYAAHAPGGIAGIPMGESRRVSDVEVGRLLRQGQPILRPLDTSSADMAWQLVTSGGNTAQEIVDNWLGNRRLIRAAAEEFGVSVLFIWQPALFTKANLTDFEAQSAAEIERSLPGFMDLYREVDILLREHPKAEAWDDVVLLSDVFREVDEEIFFDEVHINELGNLYVAEAIVNAIAERLETG